MRMKTSLLQSPPGKVLADAVSRVVVDKIDQFGMARWMGETRGNFLPQNQSTASGISAEIQVGFGTVL